MDKRKKTDFMKGFTIGVWASGALSAVMLVVFWLMF